MTRAQWEERILELVREQGGFSVFMVNANPCLAHAVKRLEERGEIVRVENGSFPWCAYKETNP